MTKKHGKSSWYPVPVPVRLIFVKDRPDRAFQSQKKKAESHRIGTGTGTGFWACEIVGSGHAASRKWQWNYCATLHHVIREDAALKWPNMSAHHKVSARAQTLQAVGSLLVSPPPRRNKPGTGWH